MNLVSFSIRTKDVHNFTRRLWTVFTRFGFSEGRVRKSLYALTDSLRQYSAAPTFFIPAVVLRRHPKLIRSVTGSGAEIGIHGYVYDYSGLYALNLHPERGILCKQALEILKLELPRNPHGLVFPDL